MKVISLWQPFASLIFVRAKLHETRSFSFPRKLRGQRIAIHATLNFTPQLQISEELAKLCDELFGKGYESSLPRGAILGTVVLIESHATQDRRAHTTDHDVICGNWDDGRQAWELADVEKLDMVVPAKGKQGWWDWNPEPLTFEILDKK